MLNIILGVISIMCERLTLLLLLFATPSDEVWLAIMSLLSLLEIGTRIEYSSIINRNKIYHEGNSAILLSEDGVLRILRIAKHNLTTNQAWTVSNRTNGLVTLGYYGKIKYFTIIIKTTYKKKGFKFEEKGYNDVKEDWEYLNFLSSNFDRYVKKILNE